MKLSKIFTAATLALGISVGPAMAADYVIDTKGAHASVNIKVKHLGYSWLTGRFNEFSGKFSYDADKVADSKIMVVVKTGSFDSNHAKRDKHVKSNDYLGVSDFPEAKFESTSVTEKGDGKLAVEGNLTLRGITKKIVIDAEKIGEGKDPWGGYRAGFSGTTMIAMKDFGLGAKSPEVHLELHIEGIRK